MNWASDAPQWLQEAFDELDVKARRQIVRPDVSPERSAGYFAAIEDVRAVIEAAAEDEEALRQKHIREAAERLKVVDAS